MEAGKAEYQEGKDTKGPVTIGAVTAVETQIKDEAGKKKYAKIVVYGDSDFANNTNLNLAGNKDLFLNTIGWLAEEEDLIAIRSKNSESNACCTHCNTGRLIFWLPVIVFPSIVLATGLLIYNRRRAQEVSFFKKTIFWIIILAAIGGAFLVFTKEEEKIEIRREEEKSLLRFEPEDISLLCHKKGRYYH